MIMIVICCSVTGGVVNLTSAVDFDAGTRQYDLTVRVSDGVHNVDVLGTVVILPVNEAAPVFTSSGSLNIYFLLYTQVS